MPVGLHGLFHPFQIEADKPAESIHGNLAFAVGPADRLHTDFEDGGQFIAVNQELFMASPLCCVARCTVLTIRMRRAVVKEARGDTRGQEGTLRDT
jgi:hypothetical protein